MHVGIDITPIIYQRGVSRYTSNLVRALHQHTKVQLHLYGSSLRQRQKLLRQSQRLVSAETDIVVQPYPPSALAWLWKLHLNPIRASLPHLDVFHSWDYLQPPDNDLPLVSTIHDLAMLKFPETAHPAILAAHRQSWQQLKKRQAHIIAVSQATKHDIVELLEIPPSRISVIYEALPMETTLLSAALTEEIIDQVKARFQLNKPYILFVGTREPRKNLHRLIEACQPLARSIDLVVVGAAGWDASGSRRLPAFVRLLGQVSDQELAALYSEAELLAYPSLYEGFGLPILEAFHFGTPVVTATTSSMPEVAGNAAELVDPLEVTSIRSGIEKILGESTLAQQQRLQKMIIRLHLFSWQKVAEETAHVYAHCS